MSSTCLTSFIFFTQSPPKKYLVERYFSVNNSLYLFDQAVRIACFTLEELEIHCSMATASRMHLFAFFCSFGLTIGPAPIDLRALTNAKVV